MTTRRVPRLLTAVLPTPLVVLAALPALLGACASDGTTGPSGHYVDAPAVDADGFVVLEPGVAASAQPSRSALERAAAVGYRTVVNFRSEGETPSPEDERKAVEGLGLSYVHIPVKGPNLSVEHAAALAEVLDDPGRKPVLLHCSSGNRAAGAWALYLARFRNVPPDEAVRRGEAAGMQSNVRAVVERQLAR